MQTNTEEVSRTSLALRAAESAKGQREDRDSLVSTDSASVTSDSIRANVRSAFSPFPSSRTAAVDNEITKVSMLLVSYFLRDVT